MKKQHHKFGSLENSSTGSDNPNANQGVLANDIPALPAAKGGQLFMGLAASSFALDCLTTGGCIF